MSVAVPYTASYDGHPFDGMPYVLDYIERPLMPEATVTTTEVSGRDGAAFGSLSYGPASVRLALHFEAASPRELSAMRARLAAWLHVDSPRVLTLSDEPDTYRLAVPTGTTEVEEWACGLSVNVDFTCPDPRRYMQERSQPLSDGSSVVYVEGTAPVRPVISLAGASGDVRLTLDDGAFLLVKAGGTAADLVLDNDRRVATLAGARVAPTVESDWFELSPGEHVIRVTSGTVASGTVTWRPAWL